MKKGFSLSEIMVSLAIIGIISAITLPILFSVGDDTNKYLFKKAFQLTASTVNSLIEDSSLYPNGTFNSWTLANRQQFCQNFASKVNTIGSVNCSGGASDQNVNFITSNGMKWSWFTEGSDASDNWIRVDINGNNSPDQYGTDLFFLRIYDTGKIDIPQGWDAASNSSTTNAINYLSQ